MLHNQVRQVHLYSTNKETTVYIMLQREQLLEITFSKNSIKGEIIRLYKLI